MVIDVVPTPLMVTEPVAVILATLLLAIWKENTPVLLEVAVTSNPGSPNILFMIVGEVVIIGTASTTLSVMVLLAVEKFGSAA